MRTDAEIQKDVMEEFKWEPFLTASEIGVAVRNGIVTLSGTLDSYAKKLAAEKAAKRISGVKAVAEDIQVKYNGGGIKNDTEVAEAVLDAFKWNSAIKENNIKTKVENGIVTLEGQVDWEFERRAIRSAIQNLNGVRGIVNNITIAPQITPSDIKQKIHRAFHRHATLDANGIEVATDGSTVTLSGKVRSWAEKRDAEYAVWGSPGVNKVINKLEIESEIFAV
jgi:osmotically-inducible protein OsmY